MIVVTGAAGFIGSCLVARLNETGRKDIIAVDHYESLDDPKRKNLSGKFLHCFYDKKDFLDLLLRDKMQEAVDCIFHLGACSSTVLQDADYFEKNNFEYSVHVAQWAVQRNVRLIYASSAATYGDGAQGYSDDEKLLVDLRPLNLYGKSKQKFDCWVCAHGYQDRMVGLKFFNVYGPNEYHKADMRSVLAKAYDRVFEEGRIFLFKSANPKYKDGEQMRDFIYVKDVVEMMLFLMKRQDVNGIFNAGTGCARTWNDVAQALFSSLGKPLRIVYVDMPDALKNTYQYFTQADMRKFQRTGYSQPFTGLEDAVKDYCTYLKEKVYW